MPLADRASRRSVGAALLLATWALACGGEPRDSIAVLQQGLATGRLTSESLVRSSLARIAALDRRGPALRAIIAVNPDALQEARALDGERRRQHVRGVLHGIPVLIKDNIETADRLPTTAGSLALVKNFARMDAPLVAQLRAAGAVILGKTNMSEWANFRSSHSTSGWSAVGGLVRNPYVLDRTACGSSSGSAVAVAALMAPVAIGTETDGSITCPAAMNGLVGLKPTVGLIAQRGIVPIAHSQDTAGPMGHSVRDIAILLGVLADRERLCARGETGALDCHAPDYAASLDPGALAGRRVGVLRFKPGSHPEMDVIYERALSRLRSAGATLVEVVTPESRALGDAELTVLLMEFKSDLNHYLAGTVSDVQSRDLHALIEFDRRSPYELEPFGQDIFVQAEATAGTDDPRYRGALESAHRLARDEGLDRMLREQRLDLLVAPTTTAAWRVDSVNGDLNADSFTMLPAVAGYPHLTVPMGTVQGLPVGLSFMGPAWSEPLLLACGAAFEARTPTLDAPHFVPTLETDARAAKPRG